jgi:hypothetical protein
MKLLIMALAFAIPAWVISLEPTHAKSTIVAANWKSCATGIQHDEPSFDEIPVLARAPTLRPYYDSDPRLLANHGLCNVKFHRVVLCFPGWQGDHLNTPADRVCRAWENAKH